jgi:hypothetical protein
VVLPELNFPQGGAANWANGFLPAHHQGTTFRAAGSPVLDLAPPPGVTEDQQRANLDLLAQLNDRHRREHPEHADLAARVAAYELAFRMQAEVPGLIDLAREDAKTLESYGIGRKETDEFGRRCLLARRLVEAGVRFVQVYASGWDSHDYLERSHSARLAAIDKPIAALVKDLKQRGLLDQTLVVWCGEFGRSPDNGVRGGGKVAGRDHNAQAMAVWLAGGGVKAGHAIGATDEIGHKAVEVVHPLRDLHVTLLHLLGSGPGRQQAHLLPRGSLQAALADRRPGDPGTVGLKCLPRRRELRPRTASPAGTFRSSLDTPPRGRCWQMRPARRPARPGSARRSRRS